MNDSDRWREAPLVDEAAVQRLRSLRAQVQREGEDVLGELLELFRKDSLARIDRMRRPQRDDDVKHTAHALKGAAMNVGAARVAALALFLERKGAATPAELDTLLAELRRAEEELARRLAP
jgi:HPt (histidine-containing phosphotransfer) domain-containing protein